jgi:hypothetical protein
LLSAVEAMDFVEEEDRPFAEVFEVLPCFGEYVADFLDTGSDSIQRFEAALRVIRNDMSQGSFSTSWRTVEDERSEPVGKKHPAKEFSWSEKVILAHILIERSRPHPGSKRPSYCAILIPRAIEKIHGSPP